MRTNVISDRKEEGYISNSFYRHILADEDIYAAKDYLDLMNKFYFKLMSDSANTKDSQERSELRCIVQMMFTKGVTLRKMMDGFSFHQGFIHLNNITDHTILHTIVRTMFEALMGFELVNRIPNTEDKHTIIYNVYCASSLNSRLKMFTEDEMVLYAKRIREERGTIELCKKNIKDTELYSRLDSESRKQIKDSISKGDYQLIIDDNEKVKHVGWDDVRKYCTLGTEKLHGMYKYLCNMAHPSYYSLIQFRDSYMGESPEFSPLACTASKYALVCMSVFIMDYMLVFPDTQHSFEELDGETQFMISMYNDIMRKASMA